MPSYTVVKGDTLSGIAQKVGLGAGNWKQLGYTGDPTKLQIGTVLNWGGDTGGGNTGGAFSAPAPAPSGNEDLTAFAANQKTEMQRLLDQQKAEQNSLFENYRNKMAGQEKLTDVYGRLKTDLGIPDIEGQMQVYKDQIYSVKNLLDSLEENINDRTKGSLVNESQRNRQIAYEATPLNNQLGRLGTGMQPLADRMAAASGELSTMLNLTSQDQLKELKPYEMEINMASDRFAREITGFTTSKQTELDALIDKIERGRELADREWQLAQQLAAEEREWARTKEEIALKTKYDSSSNNAWANKMAELMGTGQDGATNALGSMTGQATRVGNSDQISFGGEEMTREDFAKRYSAAYGLNYNDVLNEVYKQFPDYMGKYRNITGYTSPTSYFGL